MLAASLTRLAATTSTGKRERRESRTALLGRLLVGLLGELENLRERLSLVRTHRLLHVAHPRVTLATIHGNFRRSIGHFILTREKLWRRTQGARVQKDSTDNQTQGAC